MLFNTFEFAFFFLAVLIVSWCVAEHRPLRTWLILIASFWFYFSNNHWQILLLLATATIDWAVCLRLSVEPRIARRKFLLGLSLVSNLGILFYFKYANFAGGSVAAALTALGWRVDWVELNILLPVGISFFTFEALSYTIDVYRGHIPAERQWHRLAFLVSFFPHLIAGPIVRAADFFPQMNSPPKLSAENFESGLHLIATGLVKKIVLADTLAVYADAAFGEPGQTDMATAWIGVYAFAFQIYFDFSEYTDVARGCSRLLGYELPLNFRNPYAATSITDFWRRWHMSLSTWLRDYVYVSLGGNRVPRWRVYVNLMATMLIGGIWHGAAWHFVVWGGLHGCLLSIEKATGLAKAKSGGVLRALVLFHLFALLWIPFRASDMEGALLLTERLISFQFGAVYDLGMAVAALLVASGWAWQLIDDRIGLHRRFRDQPAPIKAAVYAAAAFTIFIVSSNNATTFIYFQF